MNENINLYEILKGHEGEIFYSPTFGNIKFNSISRFECCYFESENNCESYNINFDGTYCKGGEVCVFPSKDQRDWNKWIEEQKPKVPKTWSELVKTNQNKSYGVVINTVGTGVADTPIEKSALALLKIFQLIEAGYGGNVTNKEWANSDGNNLIYIPFYNPIEKEFQSFGIFSLHRKSLIAFHTYKQIKEFIKYPENVQLLKDYFMI